MSEHKRLFYGWVVVATAALGLFLGAFPITVFSFGVFFPSFVREFHASRGAVSLAFTVHNLVSGSAAVLVGRLVDRAGARNVVLPGLVLLGIMLVSAEAMDSRLRTLYLFYAALGIVAPMTTTVPYALVVSRWFDRRRGVALGLMMVGLGGGAIVMPAVAQRLIASDGWRSAFALVGCFVIAVGVPAVALLLRETPRDVGLLPDGDAPVARHGRPSLEGMTWRESVCTGRYWLMFGAFVLLAASVHACVVHIPELLADRGFTPAAAATASSVAGLALLVGRIGCGYFLDRCFGPRVAVFVCAGAALGIALLWAGVPGAPAFAGAFLVGLGMGAEVDIIVFLMSRYFGLRALGATFGFSFGAFVIAGGIGPLVMGLAFDRTGSYRVALAGFFAAALVAAALVARLGPYRFGVAREEDAPAESRQPAAG